MSRLIEADKLLEDLTYVIETMIEEYEDDDFGIHNEYSIKYLEGNINFSEIVKKLIEKQRTAYYVDKVMEQIDDCQSYYVGRSNSIYKKCTVELEKVLEIVEKGGIE